VNTYPGTTSPGEDQEGTGVDKTEVIVPISSTIPVNIFRRVVGWRGGKEEGRKMFGDVFGMRVKAETDDDVPSKNRRRKIVLLLYIFRVKILLREESRCDFL